MAGFREFVTGEVLTASNVDDFLMKQTVQKYADAAARDAALGTAVAGGNALREGMVAYLDDEDEVQFYDGTAWDAISQPIAGIGSNVVSVTKTDTFTTSSATPVLITGLEVSITPSSATSKVLLIFSAHISSTTIGGFANTHLFRGSTEIVRGDSSTRVYGSWKNTAVIADTNRFIGLSAGNFLDSPASAASVTYSLRLSRGDSGSAQVNRPGVDVTGAPRTVATLTVIEVAA